MSDHENRRGELSPNGGLLAFGGSRRVYGQVHLQQAPQIVPANLADLLDPERDARGAVRDWHLNPVRLAQQHSTMPGQLLALRDTFTKWRSTFVLERALGDVATMRDFLTWAAPLTDVSTVRTLLELPARVDPATATRMARQVQAAGAAARRDQSACVGVAAPGRAGLVRAFRVTNPAGLVIAAGDTQVTAIESGLEVVVRPQAAGTLEVVSADDHLAAGRSYTVLGWSIGGDGLTARTPDGPVRLGDTTAGALLARVAPGVGTVDVHAVPVTSVFADLLVNLPAVALDAARRAVPLVVAVR